MDRNTIRALIFLVAGLIVIIWPHQTYKFQSYVCNLVHLKIKLKSEKRYYTNIGIFFIIIAIILFVYSIIY